MRFPRRHGHPEISSLSSARDFHQLIRHECKLADRHGQKFSLVVLEVGTSDENSITVRQLVRSLYRRFRSIDEVGWFGRHQLGIFLPYTSAKGAFKLAEDVAEMVAQITPAPPFTIYSYPSENWPVFPSFDWRQLRPSRLIGRLTAKSTLRNSAEFRSALNIERDRADRNGHIFSLALVDVNKMEGQGISVSRWVHRLNLRLRLTDLMGWYDDDRIGLLLPYTSFENTHRLMDRLSAENRIPLKKNCEIYTYPTQWIPGSHADLAPRPQNGGGERPNSGPSRREPQASSPEPVPAAAEEPAPASNLEAEFAIGSPSGLPVSSTDKPFEPFVVKSIPVWKRTMDVAGASAGILATSWLMVPIAIAIKLHDNGPIIYKGKRAGLGGRTFPFYKFRTMVVDADKLKEKLAQSNEREGPVFKMTNDPRVTPLGRFLRKWSLDELPQFFNVLNGDMSLVGPRPPTPDEVAKYYNWHDKRLEIKPGITCLWQVYARHKASFDEWVRLDIQYARSKSFLLDCKILALTLPAVLSHKGAA